MSKEQKRNEEGKLMCQVCEKFPSLGVACVPGVPVSVAYCGRCIANNAIPLWIAKAEIENAGGKEKVADWFLAQTVFKDGDYVQIKDLEVTNGETGRGDADPESSETRGEGGDTEGSGDLSGETESGTEGDTGDEG